MLKSQNSEAPTAGSFTRIIVALGVIMFSGSGLFWWQQVANSRENVFYTMISNNMRSFGVTKNSVQSDGVQTLDQTFQLQTGAQNVVHAKTVLSQEAARAEVTTESVGTPTQDFVRYSNIETDQTNAKGQALDFSQIIGTWGASDSAASIGTSGGELFGEAVLGVVPAGYVPPADRKEIMNFIKENKVYEIDFSKVEQETVAGRSQYIYNASVKPENYIAMLKMFGRSVGLTQLEAFEPVTFRDSPVLEFQMIVDVSSRQLLEVSFGGSARIETYSGYGVRLPVTVPEETIPVEELQLRLQNLQ